MLITKQILRELSDKYNLNYDEFKFITVKNFFKDNHYIYYSSEEYFFKINKHKNDLKKYFPYFSNLESLSNLEIWIKSISLTIFKKNKIVSNLKDGLKKRNEFKKKYNV